MAGAKLASMTGREPSGTSAAYKSRLSAFASVLSSPKIEIQSLRELAFNGIPECTHLRPLIWRILLNYLPSDRQTWDAILKQKRKEYYALGDELLPPVVDACATAHPLDLDPASPWQGFFRDNEVLLQIDKDVRRLCPDIHFFQSNTRYPHRGVVGGSIDRLHTRVNYCSLKAASVERVGLGVKKLETNLVPSESSTTEAHWEVVERILFVYAKLNPGQGYVQGMNEIIGPIYYTLATDPDTNWSCFAEADTFYLFTNLMAEIRDFFIRSLDNSKSGIQDMIQKLMTLLKEKDKTVYDLLERQEIHPQYYCFRWLTLLLSQEFQLPDVIRIWDSLLADESRFKFLIQVCCAMIIHLRKQLLSGDFSNNMKLLQNFPSVDVSDILHLATKL